MKKLLVSVWLAIVATGALAAMPAESARDTMLFDTDWHFLKGDASGAEQPMYDESAWRRLNVPHDWSIEGPFSETNQTGGAGGFLPSGIGWYRKNFTLSDVFSNRCVCIEFDGVMQNSDVWINGFHLGHRPYGYVSFQYDLTGHLNFGANQTNVLAVRADTSDQPASRWYSGAGIYRHVRLIATGPVHIVPWGIFVSAPQVDKKSATIRVQAVVTNEFNAPWQISLSIVLLDPDGKIVGQAETQPQMIARGTSKLFEQGLVVKNPRPWDLEIPQLYRARVLVNSGGLPFDEDSVSFGIREAKFEADTGFWLNGKNLKIKGVCLHEDGGAFGAAVPSDIWEERLKSLKQLGVNAIRTAHNPPAPEFLDLCDRMGFLVLDELFDCWTVGKPGLDGHQLADYHLYFNDWSKIDLADTVRRDRNHPSIIAYSAGNEIHDTPNAALANKILSGLVQVFHENDPTRPVSQALFRPNVSGDYTNGLADLLDVVGQNYRENEILAAHEQKPARKILGTENRHDRATWLALRDHAPYAGQFLWTGVDYLGEARRWPLVGHGSGLLDRTGAFRPVAYERQSWWSDEPMVAITRRVAPTELMPTDPGYGTEERYSQVLFADWTPKNAAPHDENVEVYSNAGEVELFLNGKSLGVEPLPADASPRVWKVAYAPGTLKAVARNHGRVVAADKLFTAGQPAKILLSADRRKLAAGWDDVACVRAMVVDAHGILVPVADNLITFNISGPGVIAAVDNANNSSHESFQAQERRAFQGKCAVFVKASAPSGKMIMTASSLGLQAGTVVIRANPPSPSP